MKNANKVVELLGVHEKVKHLADIFADESHGDVDRMARTAADLIFYVCEINPGHAVEVEMEKQALVVSNIMEAFAMAFPGEEASLVYAIEKIKLRQVSTYISNQGWKYENLLQGLVLGTIKMLLFRLSLGTINGGAAKFLRNLLIQYRIPVLSKEVAGTFTKDVTDQKLIDINFILYFLKLFYEEECKQLVEKRLAEKEPGLFNQVLNWFWYRLVKGMPPTMILSIADSLNVSDFFISDGKRT